MTKKNCKKLLIIAPHGDDELNLLGTVANRFIKKSWQLHLLLVTNGDYLPKVTEKRHAETEAVAKKMGISKITYLGYGDDPGFDSTHTYHTLAPKSRTTPGGRNCTYGFKNAPDHAFHTHGVHRPYCRDSVKADMKEVILSEKAECIVCVDLDEHADHRMTSLLFDEILRELICTTPYRPIVLKKYAYAGVWFGPDDYYANPMAETRLTTEEYFPYSSEQATRVQVPRRYYPIFCKRSPIYKLCKIYRSQYVTEHFNRMVNADALYFYRDCNNLAIGAQVEVSSGNGSLLHDFKLADTSLISNPKSQIISEYESYTWIPDTADPQPTATFRMGSPQTIRELRLHLPYQEEYRPKKVKITIGTTEKLLSTGHTILDVVTLDPPFENVAELTIQILEGIPGKCGLREVEIFDHCSTFPRKVLPLKPYRPNSLCRYRPLGPLVPKFCHKLSIIKQFCQYDLRSNGIKYYLSRLLRKLKRK